MNKQTLKQIIKIIRKSINEEDFEQKEFEKKALQILLSKSKSKDVLTESSPVSTNKKYPSPNLLPIDLKNDISPSNITSTQDNHQLMTKIISIPTKITDYFKENVNQGDFSNLIDKKESVNIAEPNEETQQGDETNKNTSKKKRYSINIKTQKSPAHLSLFGRQNLENQFEQQLQMQLEQYEDLDDDVYQHLKYLSQKQARLSLTQQQIPTNLQLQMNNVPSLMNIQNLTLKKKQSTSPKQATQQITQQSNNAATNTNQVLFQNKLISLLMEFLQQNQDRQMSARKYLYDQQNNEGVYQLTDSPQFKNEDFDILREYQFYFPHNNISSILNKIQENQQPQSKYQALSPIKKIKRSKTKLSFRNVKK